MDNQIAKDGLGDSRTPDLNAAGLGLYDGGKLNDWQQINKGSSSEANLPNLDIVNSDANKNLPFPDKGFQGPDDDKRVKREFERIGKERERQEKPWEDAAKENGRAFQEAQIRKNLPDIKVHDDNRPKPEMVDSKKNGDLFRQARERQEIERMLGGEKKIPSPPKPTPPEPKFPYEPPFPFEPKRSQLEPLSRHQLGRSK